MNKLFIIPCILLLTLTSCGYLGGSIQNRDKEYLNAKSVPPLRIPPGLSSSSIQSHYPVSERNYPESMMKVDLTPPELNQQ